MTTAMTVNFHGAVLYGSRIGDIVYVALKPIVEAMGLAWQGQLERVKRDPVLKEGVSVMLIPSARGGTQETVALKLDLVPGWLFTISALRIKSEEIRAKVVLFQRECYEVLTKHFLGEHGQRSPSLQVQSLSVRMTHEARMLFGKRAAAEVWFTRGDLPHTPSMTAPPDQGDLFTWAKKKPRKKRAA